MPLFWGTCTQTDKTVGISRKPHCTGRGIFPCNPDPFLPPLGSERQLTKGKRLLRETSQNKFCNVILWLGRDFKGFAPNGVNVYQALK